MVSQALQRLRATATAEIDVSAPVCCGRSPAMVSGSMVLPAPEYHEYPVGWDVQADRAEVEVMLDPGA